jgi:hypothetical protein
MPKGELIGVLTLKNFKSEPINFTVCSSISLYATTQLPLRGFSLNVLLMSFTKMFPIYFQFCLKSDKINGTLCQTYMYFCVHLWKPKGKSLHGRPREILEDIIKLDLKEIGWNRVEWINLVQNRV